MALVVKDRVKVTTTTTGTGTLTLGSAVAKFQDFSVIGDGNTTYYAIESGTDWEVGVGTYTASGTTLSRDTILESSNAGSAINLSGTSTVFCTYPAERSVNTADIGTTIQAYDADTAKYDDTTANFTGTLQNGGSNVVVDSDIGSTVQAYDADTTKNDVANTFTANQTINGNLTVDTNTLYVDSANNNVGIGTSSPANPLTVSFNDNSQKWAQFLNTNAGSSSSGGLLFGNDSNGAQAAMFAGSSTYGAYGGANSLNLGTFGGGAVTFLTSNAERMRIDSSGNVLIGTTTSPAGSKELVLGGDYIEGVVAIGTVGATHTITLANGTVQTATLTSATACTFTMPSNVAGKSFILLLKQPASGTATTATFTNVKWTAAGAPTITATVGKMDILSFVADGTNWYGSYTQGYTP